MSWYEGEVFCIGCKKDVDARLTTGKEMYPHRPDLAHMQFWVCDTCGSFVGCHKGSTRPLGYLASEDIKVWRKQIHDILDPLWKKKKIGRSQAYAHVGNEIGRTYHTAEIYSVEEGKRIYEIVKTLKEKLDPGPWNK